MKVRHGAAILVGAFTATELDSMLEQSSGEAFAGVIAWENANLVIPNDINGLYINVETRVTGSTQSSTPGWDLNPYSATALTFFSPAGGGIFRLPLALTPSSVSDGTLIDSAGVYGSGNASTSSAIGAWSLNADNYFGFKFVAADGGTKYGWGTFAIGSALNGPDRMIKNLYYEDSGAGITVNAGSGPASVPEPSSLALCCILGAAGVLAERRRRQACSLDADAGVTSSEI